MEREFRALLAFSEVRDEFDKEQYEDQSGNYFLLHEIAANNDEKLLTKLVSFFQSQEVKIDFNQKYRRGETPLHVAALNNKGQSHLNVLEILLNNGADPNAKDNAGYTTLYYLVCSKEEACSLEILKLFSRYKADFVNVDNYKSSLLIPVVDNLSSVKFLVQDIGLDVNGSDKKGWTPLHQAAYNNENDSHYDVLEYLLEMGADPHNRDRSDYPSVYQTPFYLLFRTGNSRVLDLFLKYRPDLDSVNKNFDVIVTNFHDHNSSSNIQILNKLIDYFGIDVNRKVADDDDDDDNDDNDDGNESPYLDSVFGRFQPIEYKYAKNTTKIRAVKFLLKKGANINYLDYQYNTPLSYVASRISRCYSDKHKKMYDFFDFLIELTDFSVIRVKGNYIINWESPASPHYPYFLRKRILEHFAKLKFHNIPIHQNFLEAIQNRTDYNDHFEKCSKELEKMKDSKPQNSWINYLNLLVDSRRKLKNYAGNPDLIEDYENNDWLEMFPIYGTSIKKNFEKGLKRRKLFDESSILLSEFLPVFNPSHLIVKDIFDCILSKKDLSKFCECLQN